MKIEPRKRFGQHFLIDNNVIQNILTFLSPHKDDRLVEIGPGMGALTLKVLPLVNELFVIELDRDLIPILEKKALGFPAKLIVIQQDVLTVDFFSLKEDERQLRIFGNLPYNISTPLIFHLLNHHTVIADMIFMLQKEVAERLYARPGNKSYGRLSVMVQYHADVFPGFVVLPSAFKPEPKVMSQMIKIIPHQIKPYQASNETLFAEVVKSAFNGRRKTLKNSLKNYLQDLSCDNLTINLNQRAEELSVADFVMLANFISQQMK